MPNSQLLIDTYRPNLPDAHWHAMADLVRNVVRSYAQRRNYEAVRVALIVLSGFADWVYSVAAAPLTPAILRPDLIDAYEVYRRTEVQPNVAAKERKLLYAVSGNPAPTERDRAHSTTLTVAAPYGATDLTTIRDWATWQPNRISRISANGLVGLGLGAGLRRSELILTHRKHIHRSGTTVTVDVVGARARRVPVDPEWADNLLYAAEATTGYLVAPRGTSRTSNNYRNWFIRARGTAPLPVRMRNTWLLARLLEEHTADDLVRMSGVSGIRSLDNLIYSHAPHRSELLHGARSKR